MLSTTHCKTTIVTMYFVSHYLLFTIILLLGILQSVTNLSADVSIDKIVNISWTTPYTIDVPSTDPDITYCVDIYDTSAVEPTLKYSKCEINQTSHQCAYYPILIACAEYQVKVIAVNKVGNSTATEQQVGVKGIVYCKLGSSDITLWGNNRNHIVEK